MQGNKYIVRLSFFLCVLCAFVEKSTAQKTPKPAPPLTFDKGKLIYTPDSLNNGIPDFSYCGYKASEQPIPDVAIKIRVPVTKGDATLRIQSAIDYVATLTPDANGFRGAVLLEKGVYKINSSLVIETSGVVIRGSGINETIIENTAVSRTPVIIFKGSYFNIGPTIYATVTDSFVPANAASLHVDYAAANMLEYPNVEVIRPSTTEWIKAVGCSEFGGGISALGWKEGDANIVWHRKLKSIEGNKITLDAPITSDIDAKFGVAKINFYHTDARIENCGIENLTMQSVCNKLNAKDEDHSWDAVEFANAKNCWVQQIDFKNFAGSGVFINKTAQNITVQDCRYLQPVSETGGGRRNAFISEGQQILFQRCYTENALHSFSVANTAAGPNAFVQCESNNSLNYSGAINNWCSGTLFDIVTIDGNAIRFDFRGQDGNGAGWAGVNSVLWNCSASLVSLSKPPTANNYAFGTWAQFNGNGYWAESNNTINPRSLFYTQLKDRTGQDLQAKNIMPFEGEASSSPSVEVAQQLTREAAKPRIQLKEWIETASKRNPLNASGSGIITIDAIGIKKTAIPASAPALQIKNGWLVRGDELQTGKRTSVQWWSGGLQAKDIQQAKPHITRFVPGKTGKGLTDDLNEVVTEMKTTNTIAIEHNYGLWYDRRRDDHERIRRMDGEVWPPFYELPFARSGIGTAWDGLSKYDLTKYNKFYWSRLKQFADLADQNSLVLVHQNYFQHNIIEAGAHYADFPWRTANNINNTGFTEPVNYAGDKRIFYAEQFYDITNPVRKELHKKYIRQCLNNFKDNNGVIQLISEEYTGPLHFVKFWLDVIKEWEKETGKHPLIGLSVTKDVQDSILTLQAYAGVVDIIDIRYWHYQADGTAYEPKGGQNLAPRQHARLLKPKKTSFEQVYRAVKEYKEKFPGKAVVYSSDSYPEFGMAVLMAGGSLPVLPADIDKEILKAAATMKPVAAANGEYVLTDGKKKIIYNSSTKKVSIQ